MVRTAQAKECRRWQEGKTTPSDGKRSAQQFTIAAVHQLVALGNEATHAVLEGSARGIPVFGGAPLAENRGCDLAVRMTVKASIEREERVMQALAGISGQAIE